MDKTYSIHPAIGIARIGNSPDAFYLAPENPAQLPQECDQMGNAQFEPDGITPKFVARFKDGEGRIKRQAARFRIFVTDDESPKGRPLRIGDHVEGGGNSGKLIDIQWRVYLANKKACWREFRQLEGEHGYMADHPRRNAAVTGAERARLIIDPGPRIVSLNGGRTAAFDRSGNGVYSTTFPPETTYPHVIDTLGELTMDDDARLIVLGGMGHSGSERTGPGEPRITDYANNDGWYDDIADGPVMARLVFFSEEVQAVRFVDVEYPAWVLTGYPSYAPEILDIVTMQDVMEDMFLREMACDTALYGALGSFDDPQKIDSFDATARRYWRSQRLEWNPEYHPGFYAEIWPILFRPDEFDWLTYVLQGSNYPHNRDTRGTFNVDILSQPPRYLSENAAAEAKTDTRMVAAAAHLGDFVKLASVLPERHKDGRRLHDPYLPMRQFLFQLLRLPGEEDKFRETSKIDSRLHNLPLMPLLCGDNPISNTLTAKFLRLTEHQLFLLHQWADGKFVNEKEIPGTGFPADYNPYRPYRTDPPATYRDLDKGVLSNILGGAFCPGGEVGWIMRNPSIYRGPYRIKADLRFSTFRLTAAQASYRPDETQADDYIAYHDLTLSQDNDFDTGLQPGDLTKYMSCPWQSDFNECSSQPIDVTYEGWNDISTAGDARLAALQQGWETLWWPAHRPMQTFVLRGETVSPSMEWWAKGIQQTNQGNLKMVTAWSNLNFVLRNPLAPPGSLDVADPSVAKFVAIDEG